MKCPHCDYVAGEFAKDHKGDFFQLPVELKRQTDYGTQERVLYACPVCLKTFIEE